MKICVAEELNGKCIGLFLSEYYLRCVLAWRNIKITTFKSLEVARAFLWDKYEDNPKFDLKKLEYNRFLFYEGYEPEKNTYWENVQAVCRRPIWSGEIFEKEK